MHTTAIGDKYCMPNVKPEIQTVNPKHPYLTSGVDRLLHLPSTEAVSARPNARPRM